MKKQKILENEEDQKTLYPSLSRIFIWFALGAIILAVSIPRVLKEGAIEWAPVLGVFLGFFGIGMGLAQIIYFYRQT